jgi:hypothetical protein
MKHIVLFSGGAASSYVADLVAREHGKKDVILLHTPTYAEHPDADRFRKQVSDHIGIPMTIQADGRSLWTLIDEYEAIPQSGLPFCTTQLKQRQTIKYLNTLKRQGAKKMDICLYIGYDAIEHGRVQKSYARWEALGYKVEFPLYQKQISGETAKAIIRDEWKICLPEPYLHISHNNCIPCFKGGEAHFYKVWKHYPQYFEKAALAEEKHGHTVFEEKTLRDLQGYWESSTQIEWGKEIDAAVPCMCAF